MGFFMICLCFTAAGIALTVIGFRGFEADDPDSNNLWKVMIGWPLVLEPMIIFIGNSSTRWLAGILNTVLLAVMYIGLCIVIALSIAHYDAEKPRFMVKKYFSILLSHFAMLAEILILPLAISHLNGRNAAEYFQEILTLYENRGGSLDFLWALFPSPAPFFFRNVLLIGGVLVFVFLEIVILIMTGKFIMDLFEEFLAVFFGFLKLLLTVLFPFAIMIYINITELDAGMTTVAWTELPVLHLIAVFVGSIFSGAVLGYLIRYRRDTGSGLDLAVSTLVGFLAVNVLYFVLVPLAALILRGPESIVRSFGLLSSLMFRGVIWGVGFAVSGVILAGTGLKALIQPAAAVGAAAKGRRGSGKARRWTVRDLPEKITDRNGNEYWSYSGNVLPETEKREYRCTKTGDVVTLTYVYSWDSGIIITREGTFLDH